MSRLAPCRVQSRPRRTTPPSPPALAAIIALFTGAGSACAAPTLPADFESADQVFNKLFSYFGGVASYSTQQSVAVCHSGKSMRIEANFQHDNFFRSAGVGVGGYEIPAARLSRPAAASLFSVTIDASGIPAGKSLALIVNLQEDDDGDGVIDTLGNDDSWKTAPTMLLPGTNVYNIPYASFLDTDPDAGNGVQNFNTAPMLGVVLEFQTRTTFPGGIIEAPLSLLVDHVGLNDTPQSIPASCTADVDGSPGVAPEDLFMFLDGWFTHSPPGDINHDGRYDPDDLFIFLDAWFVGCQ